MAQFNYQILAATIVGVGIIFYFANKDDYDPMLTSEYQPKNQDEQGAFELSKGFNKEAASLEGLYNKYIKHIIQKRGTSDEYKYGDVFLSYRPDEHKEIVEFMQSVNRLTADIEDEKSRLQLYTHFIRDPDETLLPELYTLEQDVRLFLDGLASAEENRDEKYDVPQTVTIQYRTEQQLFFKQEIQATQYQQQAFDFRSIHFNISDHQQALRDDVDMSDLIDYKDPPYDERPKPRAAYRAQLYLGAPKPSAGSFAQDNLGVEGEPSQNRPAAPTMITAGNGKQRPVLPVENGVDTFPDQIAEPAFNSSGTQLQLRPAPPVENFNQSPANFGSQYNESSTTAPTPDYDKNEAFNPELAPDQVKKKLIFQSTEYVEDTHPVPPAEYVKRIETTYKQVVELLKGVDKTDFGIQDKLVAAHKELTDDYYTLTTVLSKLGMTISDVDGGVDAERAATNFADRVQDSVGFDVRKTKARTTAQKDVDAQPGQKRKKPPTPVKGDNMDDPKPKKTRDERLKIMTEAVTDYVLSTPERAAAESRLPPPFVTKETPSGFDMKSVFGAAGAGFANFYNSFRSPTKQDAMVDD